VDDSACRCHSDHTWEEPGDPLIGLPIVLVLAWYHGDRGEQRVRGTELAIISLLFVVGGGIFWLYDRGRDDDAGPVTAQDAAPAALPEVAVPAPDTKSIAVLPFADMSPGKDQDYMADGLAEVLLNLLAKAPDLKVIARTSSFAFKGEKLPIAEMAQKLNVARVLECRSRRSGWRRPDQGRTLGIRESPIQRPKALRRSRRH
jgi:hypothetical protein